MGMVYVRDRSKPKKKMSAKDRHLAAEWEELMKKYPPLSVKRIVPEKKVEAPTISRLPAKFDSGVAAKVAPKVYTGDKIIGIATMHKSNLTPIFSKEHAVDVASMRR